MKNLIKKWFGKRESLPEESPKEYAYTVKKMMLVNNPEIYFLKRNGDGCGMATGTKEDIENYIKKYQLQNVNWIN